jgi:F-BAR domain only protein
MKEFLNTYADDILNNHDQIGQVCYLENDRVRELMEFVFVQVHMELKRSCLDMTVDKLLEQFVLNKYTGLEKPGNLGI